MIDIMLSAIKQALNFALSFESTVLSSESIVLFSVKTSVLSFAQTFVQISVSSFEQTFVEISESIISIPASNEAQTPYSIPPTSRAKEVRYFDSKHLTKNLFIIFYNIDKLFLVNVLVNRSKNMTFLRDKSAARQIITACFRDFVHDSEE